VVHALEVANLSVRIRLPDGEVHAVNDVSFHVDAGETLCLVGESGCGKTITALAAMGLLPASARVTSGSIRLAERELVGLPESELRKARGNEIAMIFQDSIMSLNPAKTIGYQVAEPLRVHRGMSKAESLERAAHALALAGVPRPKERLANYPHELSGGLRQRVMIAMALVCEPKVLIADEPTTALDVTIQGQILELLDELKTRLGMAVLLITHDMGVVARVADRVNVMYAGRIVESAPVGELFAGSRHPYTRGLLASIPRLDDDSNKLLVTIPGVPPDLRSPVAGCAFADRCFAHGNDCRLRQPATISDNGRHHYACWHPLGPDDHPPTEALLSRRRKADTADVAILEGQALVKQYRFRRRLGRNQSRTVSALAGVSLSIAPGETVGLVGESGSGKTTFARLAVGLLTATSGELRVGGEAIYSLPRRRLRRRRRDVQMMFQDPYSSLDPRMKIGEILREPLRIQKIGNRASQDRLIAQALVEVGLPESAVDRYPHEFSGGQRQRLGLARALILKPRLIVADEPVSALDVSIRAQVLNLMRQVQATHGLSYLLISHDLNVVRYLADRVGVMYLGKLVEVAPAESLYRRPVHPYTASLLAAIPMPDPVVERSRPRLVLRGEISSAIDPPSGCRFRVRCPRAQALCAEQEPPLRVFGPGETAACHFPLREPMNVG